MGSTLSHFLLCPSSLWCHQEGACPWEWELIVPWAAVVGTSCCHHSKSSGVISDHQVSMGTQGPTAVRKSGICIWIFLLSVHGLGFAAICLLWLYRVRDEDETCFAAWKLNSPWLCFAAEFSMFPAVRQTQNAAGLGHWHRGALTSLCVHSCLCLVVPVSFGEGLCQNMLLRY